MSSLIHQIKNPDTLRYLMMLDTSLNDYMISALFEADGILEIISKTIGPILKFKGVNNQGIRNFCEDFQKNIDTDDYKKMFTLIANPPFELEDYLNKITSISQMAQVVAGIRDYEWITTHTFPGGVNVGQFEAFLILLFKNMSSPSSGDVMYKGKYLLEVKGSGGRLRGQSGYDNGIVAYIEEQMLQMKYTCPTNKLLYNLGKDTINTYKEKLNIKKEEEDIEWVKYHTKLSEKKIRMDIITNKETKKYKKAKEQFDNFYETIPKSILNIKEEINKIHINIEECILENISINLAKESIEKSIEFFVKLFSKKYPKANHIESFVRAGLNQNGTFKDNFLLEYFIFEFEYYQTIESFKYFCVVNLKEDLMLIIDSAQKFREFVYSKNIKIKSYPSFSEYAGTQGMVFSIDLKR